MDVLIVTALTEEHQVVTAVMEELTTYTGKTGDYISIYDYYRRDGSICRFGTVCAHQMGATKMGGFIAQY